MVEVITNSLLTAYATYAKAQLIRKTRCVLAAQEEFLFTLLKSHQYTEIGQQFGLKDIKTIDQFRRQVPVLPYNDYEPYTERIANGEPNVLNPDPVVYINLTSGTTGNKKRVPVTHKFQQTLRRADLASIGFAIAGLQQRNLPFGKALITNSVKLQGYTTGGIEYGPVSVGSIRRGKRLFEHLFTLPFKALEISDTLARHYVCLLFALRNPNLRGWVANFPMLILRACRYLETYGEELIYDLANGAIAPWLKLEPELRYYLEQRWTPAPKRAAELRTILHRDGKLTPQTAWSGLSYVTTARGGTSNFYLERFCDYFGNVPVFGGVYGTAEATFSVCPDFNSDGGILAIESGFFEFIPPDQWEVEHPKTLLPTEVKVGERYRILVTSYSGFYRYDIGDIVEVVGFYEQAPLIVFRDRRGGLLSSTTEKTTEYHVIQVMQKLQQEFDIKLEDFCITLSDNEFPARYLVNIELAPGYSIESPHRFLNRFEHWLKEVNNPYATVRHEQVPPPQLRILAPGSFATVRQRRVNQGMFDSQLKLPHISEDRTLLDGLVIIQEVEWIEPAISFKSLDHFPLEVSHIAKQQSRCLCLSLTNLRGADLIQANLAGWDLSQLDLSHAHLSGANLQNANLSGTNLTGAYLREANLTGADLTASILNAADLTDANLQGACLYRAELRGAFLTRTNLSDADLTDANLSDAALWNIELRQRDRSFSPLQKFLK